MRVSDRTSRRDRLKSRRRHRQDPSVLWPSLVVGEPRSSEELGMVHLRWAQAKRDAYRYSMHPYVHDRRWQGQRRDRRSRQPLAPARRASGRDRSASVKRESSRIDVSKASRMEAEVRHGRSAEGAVAIHSYHGMPMGRMLSGTTSLRKQSLVRSSTGRG